MSFGRTPRLVLLILGMAVGVGAFVSALRASQADSSPPIALMVGAFVLVVLSLSCSARGWIALFEGSGDRLILGNGLFTSQLAKYLPGGGVLQIAGQVSLSRAEETPLARVSMAYPVSALTTISASATVAGVLVFADTGIPVWLRATSAIGLLSPLILFRSASRRVMDILRVVIRRVPSSDLLPSQYAIWRSYAWGVPMMAATALAFALLLNSLDGSASIPTAMGGFAAAWVAGFLVVPLPAGAGVREGVLVLALGGPTSAGVVVAASLAHRVVTIFSELVTILVYRGLLARRARREGDALSA